MSKSNTKIKDYIIPMPKDNTYRVINVHSDNSVKLKEIFIMTGISEDEYNKIKNAHDLLITRGNTKFYITQDDILCYGDIDFTEGSKDCEQLDTFNWLDNLTTKGISIPSNYNYSKHECVSPDKRYRWTETFRNSTLCRYLHGCLGKPQFTLIFREIK